MTGTNRTLLLFGLMAALLIFTGLTEGWNLTLTIINMGLISAIMALGVNMQWGYAGLFNVGVVGFVALGGLGAVLVTMPPQPESWQAGGPSVILALLVGAATIALSIFTYKSMGRGRARVIAVAVIAVAGLFLFRSIFIPATEAVESVNPSVAGYLGGLGLVRVLDFPFGNTIAFVIAWLLGGLLAAGAAWIVGKTALGLRSDYLAIATLGIAEIIIAILKNEEWLARGVKNVNGIPRPVPYEIDLQEDPGFVESAAALGLDPVTGASLAVKFSYMALFAIVLVVILVLAQLALNSPWGRMMRAIRDNEVSAEAMGKDVTGRHLQIFIIGSAVCGMAGAMMTTLDGQLTPISYQPLRYTFLIWVMVIVGGSGNNLGAVLGGMLIWFLWVMVEPYGHSIIQLLTAGMEDGTWLKIRLLESAAYMRFLTMGLILLLVLRFSPRGLLPERQGSSR